LLQDYARNKEKVNKRINILILPAFSVGVPWVPGFPLQSLLLHQKSNQKMMGLP
jgi:hypothetical protein